jgi:iron complex outermembrane receptor protein
LSITPELDLFAGGDDFKSEEVVAYEMGWRFQSESKFAVGVATFYNVYDNLRSAEPGPPPLGIPIKIANGVEGETYGVELSGTHQLLKWWRIRGGYTFLKKELSIKSTSQDLNGGRAESNDPEHQFLLQSMMDTPGNMNVGFVVRHITELPNPRVAAYWSLDARISWMPIKTIEVSLVGQNLLHDLHTEFIPSSPAPRAVERSLYGKVTCRF